ncbi:MAG: NUDIX domain-containing protein [Clostridia bacterium]|nr:NUDIX domain-containing protein [Clostridia bacterium]
MGLRYRAFEARKPNTEYGRRVCAYLIAFDGNGRIPAVKVSRGYFLLGGGVEDGESHIDAIKRECLEEVGRDAYVGSIICMAERFHYMTRFDREMQVLAYFYRGSLLEQVSEPTEANHELVWLTPDECASKLFLVHQRWAVKCIVGDRERKRRQRKRRAEAKYGAPA